MCSPQGDPSETPSGLASVSPVIGMASDILGFVGGRRQESANRTAANQNYFDRISALNDQGNQIDAAASERSVDEIIEAAAAQGRISAGSQALGASSVARLQNTAAQELSREEAIADLNDTNSRRQLGREKRGAEVERISSINRVQKPSVAGLALRLGGRGADAAAKAAKMSAGGA